MKLTKVDVPERVKNYSFTVKDGWLYYFSLHERTWDLRMYNLLTAEDKDFLKGVEGTPWWTLCVNGRIHVVFYHIGYYALELDSDADEPQGARIARTEALGW
uniref:DPPIV_N domain-containing protein n=1 Tax=Steinernema glaseri TaxID=37863 RepID=A0A1I8AKZ8_9BILA